MTSKEIFEEKIKNIDKLEFEAKKDINRVLKTVL